LHPAIALAALLLLGGPALVLRGLPDRSSHAKRPAAAAAANA